MTSAPVAYRGCIVTSLAATGRLEFKPKLGILCMLTALFIGLIAGLWRGRSTAITVAASAGAAALAYLWVGAPWHVLAGAFAGIAAAWCAAAPGPEAP